MSNKRGGGRRCLKENSILNSHFVFLDDLPDLIGNIVLKMRVGSPRRYVLKNYFFIESGLKMIQFKIQFKTKS